MPIKLIREYECGLKLFEPTVFADFRGVFMETYRQDELLTFGITENFVQDNHSISKRNVLRGMHFQWYKAQGKLIRVSFGEALFVEIDIHKDSPWFGKYFDVKINSVNNYILWVPPGFANGFLALSDELHVHYKCTEIYNPKGEAAIKWNDDEIGIDWGLSEEPIVSDKDKDALSLREWAVLPESQFLVY